MNRPVAGGAPIDRVALTRVPPAVVSRSKPRPTRITGARPHARCVRGAKGGAEAVWIGISEAE